MPVLFGYIFCDTFQSWRQPHLYICICFLLRLIILVPVYIYIHIYILLLVNFIPRTHHDPHPSPTRPSGFKNPRATPRLDIEDSSSVPGCRVRQTLFSFPQFPPSSLHSYIQLIVTQLLHKLHNWQIPIRSPHRGREI